MHVGYTARCMLFTAAFPLPGLIHRTGRYPWYWLRFCQLQPPDVHCRYVSDTAKPAVFQWWACSNHLALGRQALFGRAGGSLPSSPSQENSSSAAMATVVVAAPPMKQPIAPSPRLAVQSHSLPARELE